VWAGHHLSRRAGPYVLVQIITLGILLFVPQISLWLPSMMK
jgi:TRAP-type C4-dicarboxylate transport system permease large subunit